MDDILNTDFFAHVPPEARRGPKPGTPRGKKKSKSMFFTDEVIEKLTSNPGKWMIIAEGATNTNNSNSIRWTRKHPGFKTVCRKLPSNPPEAPLTVYAVYRPVEEAQEEESV